jgi:hypothetical protein
MINTVTRSLATESAKDGISGAWPRGASKVGREDIESGGLTHAADRVLEFRARMDNTCCTFFVNGATAEHFPESVQAIP